MTKAEQRVLEALEKYGPLFNGSLASHADVVWNSRIFSRMQRAGLITGHYEITEVGRVALAPHQRTSEG